MKQVTCYLLWAHAKEQSSSSKVAVYKHELSPAVPTLSVLLSFPLELALPLQQGPPILLSSQRCLSFWISFWITPSPFLVPSSLSTSFFVHYMSSAFLLSAISLVLGMPQYPTFGSQHT